MIADKRDECGCHRGCWREPPAWTTHPGCLNPCRWPDCLTPGEADALAAEIIADEYRAAGLEPP